jgi:hypothetical protein
VYEPTLYPLSTSIDSSIATVEPFPFVPATVNTFDVVLWNIYSFGDCFNSTKIKIHIS